ncbi:MAG TPA: cytochrome P450 [Mycobacteriales bacterium]|jgi:cytochrome P450
MTTQTLRDPRARPPGPRLGVLGSLRRIRRMQLTGFLDDLRASYPRLTYARLGDEHAYLLFEPDLARALFAELGRSTTKGRGLERAREILGQGLLTSEGALHRRQRRLVQPAFHGDRIAAYARIMREEAERTSAGWADGRRVRMADELGALTLRIVGRSLFGSDLSEADIRCVGDAVNTLFGSFARLMMPWAGLLNRLPTRRNARLLAARNDLDALVYRLIAEHREAGDTGDLLSMLLLARDEAGEPMPDTQVRDEVLTLLLAGHETTAMALTWTFLHLGRAPEVAARLHASLDTDLPRAVVAESMRLHPPAWIIGRRTAEDVTLDGWTIPRGTLVTTSPWVLHRDDRWWGDAAAFRPERWLTPDGRFDEQAPGQPRGAYFPFGAGRRVCIGESFAWTEAALVLAVLARDWAPEPLPETSDAVYPAITLRPADGTPMVLRRRPDVLSGG